LFGSNKSQFVSLSQSSFNRRFQFYKRRQPFIRTHNEALTIAAMRASNPDCSPAGIRS
jgi:hypothetical protein